ncbi:50S ribosomal protein L24 [bacterium]|nr:50S ribosomal protein L24 [bacterium]
MKIKKDDNVIVLTGKDKGKTGKVLKAMPKEGRVIVSGVNMFKKNQKSRRQGQKGQVVEINGSIDVSNVALTSEIKKETKKTSKKEVKSK